MCVLTEQHECSKRLRDGCCFVVQIFVAHTLCELSEQHKCSKLFRDKTYVLKQTVLAPHCNCLLLVYKTYFLYH